MILLSEKFLSENNSSSLYWFFNLRVHNSLQLGFWSLKILRAASAFPVSCDTWKQRSKFHPNNHSKANLVLSMHFWLFFFFGQALVLGFVVELSLGRSHSNFQLWRSLARSLLRWWRFLPIFLFLIFKLWEKSNKDLKSPKYISYFNLKPLNCCTQAAVPNVAQSEQEQPWRGRDVWDCPLNGPG